MFVCVFNIFAGVDVNNCYFSDPFVSNPGIIPNASHRKIIQYWDFVDDSDYRNGHGTVSVLVSVSFYSFDRPTLLLFFAFGNVIYSLLTKFTTHAM